MSFSFVRKTEYNKDLKQEQSVLEIHYDGEEVACFSAPIDDEWVAMEGLEEVFESVIKTVEDKFDKLVNDLKLRDDGVT